MSKCPIIKSIFQITISAMIILLLLISYEVVVASAAALEVSSPQGKAGDTVNVSISIADNPGLSAYRLFLDYDAQRFDAVKIVKGAAINGGIFVANTHNLAKDGILWFDLARMNYPFEGELCLLSLKISAEAQPGIYPLTLSCTELLNTNLETIALEKTRSGNIRIMEAWEQPVLPPTEPDLVNVPDLLLKDS